LYINKAAQSRIWPSIVSAFPGATGISKSFESFGQRDEPAIIGFGEALKFQSKIGRKLIEARSRELAQALIQGLQKIPGVQVWTSSDPKRSHSVVSFRPGNLEIPKLAAALYEKDRLARPWWFALLASLLQPAFRGGSGTGSGQALRGKRSVAICGISLDAHETHEMTRRGFTPRSRQMGLNR
jgi:hypothetical protein